MDAYLILMIKLNVKNHFIKVFQNLISELNEIILSQTKQEE